MKQVTISLYSYNELSDKAKKQAITNHWDFLSSTPVDIENEDGTIEMIYEDCISEQDVIENILANDYIFFQNGELANTVTYCGKHPKSGITEFNFHGAVYNITDKSGY